jgi:Uma2 family endonuclease
MAPADRTHGILQGRLATLINNHLDREQRPLPTPGTPALAGGRPGAPPLAGKGRVGGLCSVVVEPGVVPRLLSEHNLRVPDLAVTCAPYETEEAVLVDPILLIEILSLSNEARTWTNI